MEISLIVAMDQQGLIGSNNRMPWHLPADLKRFRQITWGKPILMGRKTHESIGRPLPGRRNLVMSRDSGYSAEGCEVVHGLDEAMERVGDEELMVIGGAALYRALMPAARTLYLTLIHQTFEGDVHFPPFDWGEWQEVERESIDHDPESGLSYSFTVWKRKSSR